MTQKLGPKKGHTCRNVFLHTTSCAMSQCWCALTHWRSTRCNATDSEYISYFTAATYRPPVGHTEKQPSSCPWLVIVQMFDSYEHIQLSGTLLGVCLLRGGVIFKRIKQVCRSTYAVQCSYRLWGKLQCQQDGTDVNHIVSSVSYITLNTLITSTSLNRHLQ